MNKKVVILLACIISLVVVMSIKISYAINRDNSNEIFTVNKLEVSPTETLEMTLDISKVEYQDFKIVLNSNIETNNIYTDKDTNIDIKDNTNALTIEVNKNEMKLDKIMLYYPIPENIEIGTKIQLIAQIVVEQDIETENKTEQNNTIDRKSKNDSEENNIVEKNNVIEKEIQVEKKEGVVREETNIITVIEKTEEKVKQENNTVITNEKEQEKIPATSKENNNTSNKNEKLLENEKTEVENQKEKIQSTSSNFSNQQRTNVSSTSSIPTNENKSNEATATYNGSRNNYLSNLKVKGLKLNTTFNKENSTYFITTNNTDNITITATAESENAKVCISGNKNIQKGQNKILISVTAENGDVRYYRIFVNCEEESNET